MKTFKTAIYTNMVALIGIISSLASCSIESSDNGKLDGFWHLEEVDTLATAGKTDLSERRVFWGVQHKIIFIKNYEAGSFYCRFQQTADSLIISALYLNHGHQDNGEDGGDIPVSEINDSLRSCGINHLEEHFCKEHLSSEDLTLKNKEYRLRFKKF
jgi:hypothetical protein